MPSGVWCLDEYAKLPLYDLPTGEQPPRAFMCHQQNGKLCAGWVGCHDMQESLGLRFAAMTDRISPEDYAAALGYESPVPLWPSGQAAAEHGVAALNEPGPAARRTIDKLKARHGG